MSAFWIFAVALTVAYIIYYCVIIAKDLAKPREQVSSDEETFEQRQGAGDHERPRSPACGQGGRGPGPDDGSGRRSSHSGRTEGRSGSGRNGTHRPQVNGRAVAQ